MYLRTLRVNKLKGVFNALKFNKSTKVRIEMEDTYDHKKIERIINFNYTKLCGQCVYYSANKRNEFICRRTNKLLENERDSGNCGPKGLNYIRW